MEYPTTLEVRMLARSKTAVLGMAAGHLRLLAEPAWCPFRGAGAATGAPATAKAAVEAG